MIPTLNADCFMQVAVKIINHSKDCSQIQDIRVLRETLFSTSLLHPNIVVSAQTAFL